MPKLPEESIVPGTLARVVGWGAENSKGLGDESEAMMSPHLKFLNVRVLSDSECQETCRSRSIQNSQMCAVPSNRHENINTVSTITNHLSIKYLKN